MSGVFLTCIAGVSEEKRRPQRATPLMMDDEGAATNYKLAPMRVEDSRTTARLDVVDGIDSSL